MRTGTKVFSAGLGVAALVATAAPASADHTYDVSLDGRTCTAGELASGLGIPLTTTRVRLRQHRDGTLSFRCTFTNLPEKLTEADTGYWDWERPDEVQISSGSVCHYRDATAEWYGETTYERMTPGGRLRVNCVLSTSHPV